ncbi:MAG: M20/M25/M40 family metallo-hydrolase [Planctomycetota bacterium]
MQTATDTAALLAHLDTDHDAAVARLSELLAIPSVSTDPAFAQHMQSGAKWVADDLMSMGFEVQSLTHDGGHPAILAKSTDAIVADDATQRVLFYGHYDVQPPDPLDGWSDPAFEPTIKESVTPEDGPAIFARGSSDDKGQVMCFLEALRAYRSTGTKLPCHVTVLIEGEEECGSKTLPALLADHADDLKADVALVSDTSMHDTHTVAITYGLRGLVYFDLKLHGPSRDLHSGVYGGTLPNPATVLARVLGKLFDDDNRVTIPGFYDDVAPLDPAERAEWDKLGFDESEFLGEVGSTPFGEQGFTTLERRWARPACDVNGLYGGYMGEGAKTVIPSFAGAKVSFRIPGNMDPMKVAEQFTSWLKQQEVGGCRWEINDLGSDAYPVLVPRDSPYVQAAAQAIEHVAGHRPALVREGATIPVIAELQSKLGMDTLLVGFGLHADNIHSPDEHFALRRFKLGAKVHAQLLADLASV